jgi:hypothetical protein
VNHEAGLVDGALATTDAIALLVDVNHVRHGQHAKVGAVRIDPERLGINSIYPDS